MYAQGGGTPCRRARAMKWRSVVNFFRVPRLELAVLALSVVVCALMVPQVRSFSHRNDPVRIYSWALPLWKTLEGIEFRLYDTRFSDRGPVRPRSRDRIAIIGIDQSTLNTLGAWPYPREWHAQVIRRLKKAGAKAIFLDIDFSGRQNIQSDAVFAHALKGTPNVLLPSFLSRENKAVGSRKTASYQLVDPLDANGYDSVFLGSDGQVIKDKSADERAAFKTFAALGFEEQTPEPCIISVQKDSDGALRRYPLRFSFLGGDDNIGSVAALSAGIFQNLLDHDENPHYESALKTAVWPTRDGAAVPIPLVTAQPPPGDAPYALSTLIYFWGPPSDSPAGTFPTYSYKDVKGSREQLVGARGQWMHQGFSDAEMKAKFGGRIVFIGATALILSDVFSMPQFLSSKLAYDESQIPGVEIHASVAAMLLDGVYLRAVSPATTNITVFSLSLASGLWTLLLRGWVGRVARAAQLRWTKWRAPGQVRGLVWFALYGVLATLPIVLFWEAAKWLFIHQNLWVIVIYPALGAAATTGLMVVLLFSGETAARRKAMAQFGRFMSPAILDEVLARPEEDYPRPRRAYATVLFTDLQGFTSYTETHEPEEVVHALNAYMTRMIPIVQAHNGTIDKYIGDAIMAYFGVPVPCDDHAERALRCAVALQEECARFRLETGVDFYMRVGVHTGDVIAGSMGSEGDEESQPLLNYTVIGDTVNLASRLEGKNKEFGSWIMCSAATYQAAPTVVNVESASAQIKGKSQTVDVYIVRGLADQPALDEHWGPR